MNKRLTFARFAIGTVAGVITITAVVVVRLERFTSAGGENAESFQTKPFDQSQALADLNKKIAGQESKPAAEVFKNIQILKAVPAGRLLKVMEIGYSRSLGVTCEHCHVPGDWEKDDKPTKQIARDMVGMANTINSELLKNIKNLKGPNSIVNCTTCHRGQVKPALNLPDTKS